MGVQRGELVRPELFDVHVSIESAEGFGALERIEDATERAQAAQRRADRLMLVKERLTRGDFDGILDYIIVNSDELL